MNGAKRKRYVLLDRDGTIIVEHHYLCRVEDVELLPEVAPALKAFQQMGLGLVVITNQSGIARGYFSVKTLEAIHQRMMSLLLEYGITLDAIYYCPHHPDDNCECRKPRSKLVQQAERDLGFDASRAFVVGDKDVDIELGQRVGATTFLVSTGYGSSHRHRCNPHYYVDNLANVVPFVSEYLKGCDNE